MTNEVLQKTASDEQNVSSSNGLEPSIRFKNFTKKWNKISLKEIGTFQKGAPLSKADISQEGNPFILYGELYTTYSEVTYKVFRKTDKKVDKIYFSNVGDVILPTSGETPEEIAIATCIMIPDVILAGDLYIFRQNKIDGRILSYIINHTVNGKISRIAQGKSVVHVRSEELGKIIINYPTNDEQEKIANFLSLIDQRIEKQRQLVESLKKYKRGALSRVFNDVLETVKLSDISNFISSTRTLSTTLNSNKGIYPVYDAAGIAGYIDHYDIDSDYITIVKDGSGVGRLQKCDKKSSFIGTLGALVAKNCTTDFLYAVLQTIDFSKFVTGMAIPHIYYRDYKSNLLPFPSEEKQRAISQFFKKFDKCIENETQKLSNMLKYKQGLLQQIFI